MQATVGVTGIRKALVGALEKYSDIVTVDADDGKHKYCWRLGGNSPFQLLAEEYRYMYRPGSGGKVAGWKCCKMRFLEPKLQNFPREHAPDPPSGLRLCPCVTVSCIWSHSPPHHPEYPSGYAPVSGWEKEAERDDHFRTAPTENSGPKFKLRLLHSLVKLTTFQNFKPKRVNKSEMLQNFPQTQGTIFSLFSLYFQFWRLFQKSLCTLLWQITVFWRLSITNSNTLILGAEFSWSEIRPTFTATWISQTPSRFSQTFSSDEK